MTGPRPLVGVFVTAVVVGVAVWFFGLGAVQSVVVAGVVVAVGATWVAIRDGDSLSWPVPPVRTAPGARRDVQELGWSLRSRGGVPERAIARVRAVARRRLLVLHRLDLDDPRARGAIERLLAPAVVAALTSARRPELDLAAFVRILDAIDTLGTEPDTPGPPDAGSAHAGSAHAGSAGAAPGTAAPATTRRHP